MLYPYSHTLAWSDNYLFPSLIFYLYSAIFSDITAYNLTLLSAILLNGFCMALTCSWLSGSRLGATVSGALFAHGAYISSVLGHPQLQWTFFFPLVVLIFLLFLQQRRVIYPLIIGILISVSFLTTVYFSIFLCAFVALLFLALFALRPCTLSLKEFSIFVVATTAGLLPLLSTLRPYTLVQETFGHRYLYEPFFFSATGLSFLSSSYSSLLLSWTREFSHDEGHLYLGVVPLIFLVGAFIRLAAAKPIRRLGGGILFILFILLLITELPRSSFLSVTGGVLSWLLCGGSLFYLWRLGRLEAKLGADYLTFRALLALFLFAFGSALVLSLGPLGNSAADDPVIGIYRIFFEFVPGFSAMRAISRIMVIAHCALALVIALMVRLYHPQIQKNSAIAALGLLIMVDEQFSFPLIKEPVPDAPPVFEVLRKTAAADDVAIVLPYSGKLNEKQEFESWREFSKIQVSAINWSLPGIFQLVNGYSGQQSRVMKTLPRELIDFPSNRSLAALRTFAGLRYIVYVPRFAVDFKREDFEFKLRFLRDQLKLIEQDSDGNYLFEIVGTSIVPRDFTLLSPLYPPSSVTIEVGTKESAATSIRVFAAPLYTPPPIIEIPATSPHTLSWYSINHNQEFDSVRPNGFRFEHTGEFLIGSSRLKKE